jgi:hypothetical protein
MGSLIILTVPACNKTTVSDRENGPLGPPEHNCHFVCTDDGNDDNKIVCQQCDDGDLPFCAELDDADAVIYCSQTLEG